MTGDVNAEAKVPWWLQSFVETKLGGGLKVESRKVTRPVDIDYSSAASVSRVYQSVAGRRPIVIDNFHYFDEPMQGKFSQDVRAFEERGIKIVLMGTWANQDYVERKNVDLTGRVTALSVEPWLREDLVRVVEQGQSLLNIALNSSALEFLVQKCAGNVALLQDALSQALETGGVRET